MTFSVAGNDLYFEFRLLFAKAFGSAAALRRFFHREPCLRSKAIRNLDSIAEKICMPPAVHLAAVGHGLELPAFFPWFLLVPRDGGSATIVWIADEGGLLLCCA